MPAIDIDFDDSNAALVRADGRVFVQGQDVHDVCRPPTGEFVDVEVGGHYALGLRPDGTIEGWGNFFSNIEPIPVLPAGVTYVGMAAGNYHAVLLRSDGQVEAIGLNFYGELDVPPIPVGITFVKVKAQEYHTVALLSDGNVIAWGDNAFGQTDVPPLPVGMTYTDVACGADHSLALRSDGMVIAWGSNLAGELNVPALPSGVVYELCAGGRRFSAAWRSDGILVAWGVPELMDVPATPPGMTCVQLEAGLSHGFARWSDGTVDGWGSDVYNAIGVPDPSSVQGQPASSARFVDAAVGYYHSLVLRADGSVDGFGGADPSLLSAPALPPGVSYTKLGADFNYSLALRSDGVLEVWDTFGPRAVPSLPAGVGYEDFSAASSHVLALRSDGQVAAFGNNASGQLNVPPLPQGEVYVEVDAHYQHSLFRRSDGAVLFAGTSFSSWADQIPGAAPLGLQYTQIACGQYLGVGLLSDGTAELWHLSLLPPVLPWGVYYVQVDCGDSLCWLRRSDGGVAVVASSALLMFQQYSTPVLDPGTSYLSIDAGDKTVITRVGPTCTYVGYHPGCSGSRPATRLVPRDTPRIDSTFEVRLFDLPHDIAVIGMGFQQIAPTDLGNLGIPGCELAITVDGVAALFGQDSQAVWTLPIPDQPSLVGVQFYNQALVLDLNAGNAFGAVLSDAMEGVVGYP